MEAVAEETAATLGTVAVALVQATWALVEAEGTVRGRRVMAAAVAPARAETALVAAAATDQG